MKLHSKILLGLVMGGLAGGLSRLLFPGAAWVDWVNDYVAGPAGQIFIRLLFMTVVPIVFTSITLGVAGIGNLKTLGRLGGRTMAYFVLSTLLSALLGLVLVTALRPGSGVEEATRVALMESYATSAESLPPSEFGVDTFVRIVPRNPVRAAAETDMLGLIFFSLIFGIALTRIPREKSEPVLRVIEGIGEAITRIIGMAMRLAPYGVFALIFTMTSRFGWDLLGQLGLYVAIVLGGLLIHATVGISTLVRLFARMSPLRFWRAIEAPVVTAFSTSSSMATLPTSIATAETELGVAPKIAGFVLPLGATMNMNGTSLHQVVSILFLAQVFGVELTIGTQIVVVILAVLTAIGAAGVPSGAIPLMMVVLASIGVPAEGVAIILGVDRILDMSRTVLNVGGDLSASVYIERIDRQIEGRATA